MGAREARIPGGVLLALAKEGLALEKRALEGLALERRAQKGLSLEKRALGNADVERAQESAGVALAQEGAVEEGAIAVSISSKLGTGGFGRATGSGVNLAAVGGTIIVAGGGTIIAVSGGIIIAAGGGILMIPGPPLRGTKISFLIFGLGPVFCHNESRKQQVSNTQGYLLKGMLDERRVTSW